MQLFFSNRREKDFFYFDTDESRHLAQVLRKKTGDTIHWADGNGCFFEGKIIDFGPKSVVAQVQSSREDVGRVPYDLEIAIAPTKNIDRLEWFIEKSVEIGIRSIQPIICKNSERTVIKTPRLQQIAVSAMKQSLHTDLPIVHEAVNFKEYLKKIAPKNSEIPTQRFIAHCQTPNLPPPSIKTNLGEKIIILIGPEGDFNLQEVELAKMNGFSEISLGTSRLRTETAGLVAVQMVSMFHTFKIGG